MLTGPCFQTYRSRVRDESALAGLFHRGPFVMIDSERRARVRCARVPSVGQLSHFAVVGTLGDEHRFDKRPTLAELDAILLEPRK